MTAKKIRRQVGSAEKKRKRIETKTIKRTLKQKL